MAITIGAGYPWYAVYSATGTTITYTGVKKLARMVDVTIAVEGTDPVEFYADNALAESLLAFSKGTLTLTVDGLDLADAKTILGLVEDGENTGVFSDVEIPNIPFVGFGCVKRVMLNGTVSYIGIVLPKVKFQMPEDAGTTQGETIEFQTQQLTATIYKDESATPTWRHRKAFETEAAAEAWVKTSLGYVAPTP